MHFISEMSADDDEDDGPDKELLALATKTGEEGEVSVCSVSLYVISQISIVKYIVYSVQL